MSADALFIPFPDGFAGTVISTEALEHIEDDKTALEEIWRILRPEGTFVLTVPGIDVLKHEKWYQKDYRRYSVRGLLEMLADAEFEIVELHEKFFEAKQINILAVATKQF